MVLWCERGIVFGFCCRDESVAFWLLCWRSIGTYFSMGFGYVFGFINLQTGQGVWLLWSLNFLWFRLIVLVGFCVDLEVSCNLSSAVYGSGDAVSVLDFRRILKSWWRLSMFFSGGLFDSWDVEAAHFGSRLPQDLEALVKAIRAYTGCLGSMRCRRWLSWLWYFKEDWLSWSGRRLRWRFIEFSWSFLWASSR